MSARRRRISGTATQAIKPSATRMRPHTSAVLWSGINRPSRSAKVGVAAGCNLGEARVVPDVTGEAAAALSSPLGALFASLAAELSAAEGPSEVIVTDGAGAGTAAAVTGVSTVGVSAGVDLAGRSSG